MNKILISALFTLSLYSCANRSLTEVSTTELQNKMREIDKTDYAKISGSHKEKVEHGRQSRYHALANETDKKLNHHKNEELNKKKGWDGSFSFY